MIKKNNPHGEIKKNEVQKKIGTFNETIEDETFLLMQDTLNKTQRILDLFEIPLDTIDRIFIPWLPFDTERVKTLLYSTIRNHIQEEHYKVESKIKTEQEVLNHGKTQKEYRIKEYEYTNNVLKKMIEEWEDINLCSEVKLKIEENLSKIKQKKKEGFLIKDQLQKLAEDEKEKAQEREDKLTQLKELISSFQTSNEEKIVLPSKEKKFIFGKLWKKIFV